MATVEFTTNLSLNLQGGIPGVPRQTLPDLGTPKVSCDDYNTGTPSRGVTGCRARRADAAVAVGPDPEEPWLLALSEEGIGPRNEPAPAPPIAKRVLAVSLN